MIYDYLIVGAGLYGATAANVLKAKGLNVLVVDRRNHIAGNAYTENVNGINVHKYGAHIFHTNDVRIWNYVNQFCEFNRYTNSPVANYKGKLYNLPFNMNTFYQMWGTSSPKDALRIIEEQRMVMKDKRPSNLEEQAISLVGEDIYRILIKEYSEKQWGRKATDLPAFIIKRLPVRFTFDNNYFNDKFQGIPIGGYTKLVANMLEGIEVRLNVDYLNNKTFFDSLAKKVIYTGEIDRFFGFKFGPLEYRSLDFKTKLLENVDNYQGNAVVNYTSSDVPFTRIIEHKHFEFGNQKDTVISEEYSVEWQLGKEPYYPINDDINSKKYQKYKELSTNPDYDNIIFGGRLGEYRYYDMHQVIGSALSLVDTL